MAAEKLSMELWTDRNADASVCHLEDVGPSCDYKAGVEHGDEEEVASNCIQSKLQRQQS
jgi:hypothetical protein